MTGNSIRSNRLLLLRHFLLLLRLLLRLQCRR